MESGLAPVGLLSVVLVAARAVAGAIGPVLRALAHRGAVYRLAQLDDRALKDIGLTRSEVEGALAVPLHVDPSGPLADRRRILEARPATLRPGPTGPRTRPRLTVA